MLKPWKKISTDLILENKWWRYVKDRVVLPNGQEGEYHYASLQGASVVVPRLDDGRYLMLVQYRYPTKTFSLEFPMGGCQGLSFEETARKELIEEAGVSGVLKEIGSFEPANGYSDERVKVYEATNLVENTSFERDIEEEFEKKIYTAEEIDTMISKGEIVDGYTIVAWFFSKSRREKEERGE